MSSGIAYPMPTYIPPLSVFNPLFFPQSFGTTTTSGGGGGQTNIFPNGLSSGNVITLNGGTGGGGGTGVERTITGISYLDFVDSADTNPTNITGYITLNGNTLEIGSANNSTGINVNLQGTTISANGVAIATGGNVSNDINNTFQSPATTQTFDTQYVVMDNSVLSFPNNGYIRWDNVTSLLNFPITIPNSSVASGLGLSWNNQPNNGEVDLICYGQGGQGGFAFSAITTTSVSPTLIANLFPNGIDFKQNIVSNNTFTGNNYFNTGYINLTNITGSFPSTPVGYSQFVSYNGNPWFSPTNGGGVQLITTTTLASYAPINSPAFTGTPTAPTATAGDSTTQLATTEFVSTAISNSSTIVTTQLSCTSVSFNSQWSGYIPLNITMNSFTFLFYTNSQSTSPTLNSGIPLTSNNTQFSGFGTATKQNYISNGNSQYGYIFTILNYYGAPNPSPNLIMYSVTLDTPSILGCCFVKITGLIDNDYYANLPNNNLTLIITKWN
jgi:hypothetical protein